MDMRASMSLVDGKLHVSFRPLPTIVEMVKAIDPRRKYLPDLKLWQFPAEGPVVKRLTDLFGLDMLKLDQRIAALVRPVEQPKPPNTAVLNDHPWRSPPYAHQVVGVAELVEHPAWLLAYDQGTGKTFVAANRLAYGMARGHFRGPILVLTPKPVVQAWPRELWTHAGLKCVVLAGSGAEKLATLEAHRTDAPGTIFVCNYEAMLSKPKRAKMTLSHYMAALPTPFDVVIADEVQRLKAGTSATARAVGRVRARARYRWALSGTPAPNGPEDWYGVLTFLDPRILATESKTAFEARYVVKGKFSDTGPIIRIGYKDLDDLNARVASCCSRVLKQDCLDLPEKVFIERVCELSPEQRRVYKDLRDKAVAHLNTLKAEGTLTIRNILTESLRLLQVVGGFVPDDTGRVHPLEGNAKLALLDEVLDEIGPRPTVIWCSFLEELRAVADLVRKRGEVRMFHGAVANKERDDAIDWFQQRGPREPAYFLATPQSGGTGITLTAADTEIFFSRTYKLTDYLQAIDRLHRIGQTRKVTIINLVAEATVDRKVGSALERKEAMQENMMARPDAVEDML